jgi:hypothetical protein
MNPLSACKALEVFGLPDIYSLFAAKHLDPEETENLSLTCKLINNLFQKTDPDVWRSICYRKFTYIPHNIKDYKRYYYSITSGRYLAENRSLIGHRSVRRASFIRENEVKLWRNNNVLECPYNALY